MKKIFKNYYFNMVLIIGLSALVLYFTMKDNFMNVIGIIKDMNPLWIIGLAAFILFQQAVIGWLLSKTTRKIKADYTWKEGIVNSLIAAFFHGITPSASGGQFAQAYVHNKQGLKVTDSASILWLEFVIYQSVMVVFVAILLVLYFPQFMANYPNMLPFVLIGFLVSAGVIVGLWVITRFEKVYTWISTKGIALAAKLRIVKDKEATLNNLDAQINNFNQETERFKKEYRLIGQLIIGNVLRNFMSFFFPYLVGLALGLDLSVIDIIPFMALTACVNQINAFIPIPGASGGSEAMFILFFSRLYTKTFATSMTIVWRFFSYYFLMLVGGVTFILFKRKHGKMEVEKGIVTT